MSAPSKTTLPIIDIAPFLNDSEAAKEERVAAPAALHRACVDFGFFYLNIEAYVDGAEPKELVRLAKEFFALSQEEKDKLGFRNGDHARGKWSASGKGTADRETGYALLNENKTSGKADSQESLDVFKPVDVPDNGKLVWGENQWPEVPEFREKYEAWVGKLKKLGMVLMKAWFETNGGGTDGVIGASRRQFLGTEVKTGYPPLHNDHDGVSCGAHKDYGCLTFLYADPTLSALQVFVQQPGAEDTNGHGLPREQGEMEGVWINADPMPGCVVCNIGEMWEVWTSGLYKSVLHRVVHRGTNYRISIPFFFEPNFDALVKPIPTLRQRALELAGEEVKAEYRPVVYGRFLLGKVSNNLAVEGGDWYP